MQCLDRKRGPVAADRTTSLSILNGCSVRDREIGRGCQSYFGRVRCTNRSLRQSRFVKSATECIPALRSDSKQLQQSQMVVSGRRSPMTVSGGRSPVAISSTPANPTVFALLHTVPPNRQPNRHAIEIWPTFNVRWSGGPKSWSPNGSSNRHRCTASAYGRLSSDIGLSSLCYPHFIILTTEKLL